VTVVREITEADGEISWTVNVANKKAWWYTFDVALDLPIATPVARRNPSITGTNRDALVVAPGPRSITGRSRKPVTLDSGTFMGEAVPLGELMVDGAGRLVFVPARGLGYSPTSAPLVTFSDNNGWADDICDGPVQATVALGRRLGREHSAELRTVDGHRSRHCVRLGAHRLGRTRVEAASELRRRHPPGVRANRRHAVGQRGLLAVERVGERRRLPRSADAAPTGRPEPRQPRLPPPAVRAVP
jgi:hypothetical protein